MLLGILMSMANFETQYYAGMDIVCQVKYGKVWECRASKCVSVDWIKTSCFGMMVF